MKKNSVYRLRSRAQMKSPKIRLVKCTLVSRCLTPLLPFRSIYQAYKVPSSVSQFPLFPTNSYGVNTYDVFHTKGIPYKKGQYDIDTSTFI